MAQQTMSEPFCSPPTLKIAQNIQKKPHRSLLQPPETKEILKIFKGSL